MVDSVGSLVPYLPQEPNWIEANVGVLSKLPIEIAVYILSFIPPKELLCNTALLNKNIYTLSRDKQLWVDHFLRYFPRPRSIVPTDLLVIRRNVLLQEKILRETDKVIENISDEKDTPFDDILRLAKEYPYSSELKIVRTAASSDVKLAPIHSAWKHLSTFSRTNNPLNDTLLHPDR